MKGEVGPRGNRNGSKIIIILIMIKVVVEGEWGGARVEGNGQRVCTKGAGKRKRARWVRAVGLHKQQEVSQGCHSG